MKIWFDRGYSHSTDLVIVYVFKDDKDAELFEEYVGKLVEYFERSYCEGVVKFFKDELQMKEVDIYEDDIDWEDPPAFDRYENVVVINVYTDRVDESTKVFNEILNILKTRLGTTCVKQVSMDTHDLREIAKTFKNLVKTVEN